jgi:hypothetical protein
MTIILRGTGWQRWHPQAFRVMLTNKGCWSTIRLAGYIYPPIMNWFQFSWGKVRIQDRNSTVRPSTLNYLNGMTRPA